MKQILAQTLFVLLAILAYTLLQKKWERMHVIFKILLSFCVSSVVMVSLSVLSLDSALLKFDTPEEAFHYLRPNKIMGTAQGKESCYITYKKNSNTWSNCVIPWTDGQYGVPAITDSGKIVHVQVIPGGTLTVLRFNNTNDYYIYGTLVLSKEKSLHLEDNIGSNIQFQRDTTPDVTDYYGYMYWAYVEDFGDNYEITVNGETTAIDFKGW